MWSLFFALHVKGKFFFTQAYFANINSHLDRVFWSNLYWRSIDMASFVVKALFGELVSDL